MQEMIPNRVYRVETIPDHGRSGYVYMVKHERTAGTEFKYHRGKYLDRETNTIHDGGDFYECDFIFELMPETFELEDFLV